MIDVRIARPQPLSSEILKVLHHRGDRPQMWFYRDRKGLEVNAVVRGATTLSAVECKAGETVAADFLDGLTKLEQVAKQAAAPELATQFVVYAGDARQQRSHGLVLPRTDVPSHP